ncbi:MAG: hypothetical protein BGO98_29705 [Myxococcales bacterium 68-20]|nr:MAG: hypothetical protein BGO98_29705 [Myxococcales bacterium 68-20]
MNAATAVALPVERSDDLTKQDARAARLRTLVEGYYGQVWRLLSHFGVPRDLLDDAAQEVFLVAARRIDEIRVDREKAFLSGTAFHIARRISRKGSREDVTEDIEAEPDPAPSPETSLADKQARELLEKLLDTLETDLRMVFVLHEIEGLSSSEIASIVGVPVGTAVSRLRRAREKFQTAVEAHQKHWRGKP